MKKKILFIILSVLIIAGLTACSTVSKDTVATTESTVTTAESVQTTAEKTTASETTTKKENSSVTTTKPTEQKSAGQTTTRKVTTTQKSTTAQATTKKVTTTKKQTTTKKATTTAAPYWCDEGGTHHSCDVGQIGWCNSYDEASEKAYDYLGSHNVTGNFRVKQCYGCGKFTAVITID